MMKTDQQASYQPRKNITSEFPYLQLAFLPLLVYNTLTSHKKQMVKKSLKNFSKFLLPSEQQDANIHTKAHWKQGLQNGKEIGV